MAGFGPRVVPGSSNGDTWDTAWSTNGALYLQHNDGTGFGSGSSEHDRIALLAGSPEAPATLAGTNLNPGVAGSSFSGKPCFSSGIYELDGVLYHNVLYSQQIPGAWVFHHVSMLKSTDGGANWINPNGQTNVWPADNLATCSFPSEDWGEVCFVKYGAGGVAPDVDGAQQYVYFVASGAANGGYHLGRALRTDLPSLDRSKYQFLTNADGSAEANWGTNIAQAISIATPYPAFASMAYNPALQRYLLTSFSSDSWVTPAVESTLRLMEAPHPWGPWAPLIDENVNNKESDNLTWEYLVPKFTSADGKKMWLTVSGRSPYGLQFVPVYLATGVVQTVELENAALSGVTVATGKAGYTGSGYVTGFDAAGKCVTVGYQAATNGLYLIKLRYNTSAYQTLGFYANSNRVEELALGKSEQDYATWTEYSLLASLNAGSNSLSLSYDAQSTGGCNLDTLSIAYYSTNLPPTPQTPFFGTNSVLPGTIQAENYDFGGEGVAFHDTSASNQGGAGSRNDAVDIQSISGGYCVCWSDDGEWLEYTVDIPAGTYSIAARVATTGSGALGVRFVLDGTVLGTVSVPTTGGWSTFVNATMPDVVVAGGTGKVLRLEIVGGGFNIDSFTFGAVNTNTNTVVTGGSEVPGFYRMPVFFPGYTNRAETLTHFPVLVVLSNGVGAGGFSYTGTPFASSSGYDLRFTDASDRTNLNYEIESWNTNGASHVWVQVPALRGDGSGQIWARWGAPSNTVPLVCLTNGATWSNGFVAVWHLSGAGTGDSAAHGCTAAFSGTQYATNALAAQGHWMNGNGAGASVSSSALNFSGPVTLEAWLRTTGLNSTGQGLFLSKEDYNNSLGYALCDNGQYGSKVFFRIMNGSARYYLDFDRSEVNDGSWHYLAGSFDGSWQRIYRDAVNRAEASGAGMTYKNVSATIGQMNGNGGPGVFDEVRISNVGRSSNWIWAVYQNLAVNGTFNRFGPVQSLPAITNLPPGQITASSATLRCSLLSTGGLPCTVSCCYGVSTNAWANCLSLGPCGVGEVTGVVPNLSSWTPYYYAFLASNMLGCAWTSVGVFTTGVDRAGTRLTFR
jgi:hypothetical protein